MMSEETLAEQLLTVELVADTIEAIDNLTDAYGVYASDASSNNVDITEAGVTLGKEAMRLALIGNGVFDPGWALTRLPASLIAFWGAVALGLAASFPGATTIVPPPHATFAVNFVPLMASNTANEVSAEEAADSLAALMHINASGVAAGGTVTFGVPTFPIL